MIRRLEKERLERMARLAERLGRKPERDSGFIYNGATGEFIPWLPEDAPGFQQNHELIRATIDRWNKETSK